MEAASLVIFIYVLKLEGGIYYTGITNNLVRRLKEHSYKKKGFVSKFRIVSLVYLEVADSYKEARKLEVLIKSRGAAKYINKIKFDDRYYIDIRVDSVISHDSDIKPLNQLKMINKKRVCF